MVQFISLLFDYDPHLKYIAQVFSHVGYGGWSCVMSPSPSINGGHQLHTIYTVYNIWHLARAPVVFVTVHAIPIELQLSISTENLKLY